MALNSWTPYWHFTWDKSYLTDVSPVISHTFTVSQSYLIDVSPAISDTFTFSQCNDTNDHGLKWENYRMTRHHIKKAKDNPILYMSIGTRADPLSWSIETGLTNNQPLTGGCTSRKLTTYNSMPIYHTSKLKRFLHLQMNYWYSHHMMYSMRHILQIKHKAQLTYNNILKYQQL